MVIVRGKMFKFDRLWKGKLTVKEKRFRLKIGCRSVLGQGG